MLQPVRTALEVERHEEMFLARYGRMRVWALQLTRNDAERAEDLVHDAFIQFTFSRPALEEIQNLDAYLYTLLRNLHLSQMRRTLRMQGRTLTIVDYDSAEIALRATDPRDLIRLQDELRQVCRYACTRKESSKAGGVLILRFLHGYYPREIAQVMRASRRVVEERLRSARMEARRYIENPTSLAFMREPVEPLAEMRTGFAQSTDELLRDLRRAVFDARRGECLTAEQFDLYTSGESASLDCAALAHLVSCPRCLDEVNKLLHLPLLAERYPTDTLGNDKRDGGDSGGGFGPTGGGFERSLARCRQRSKDVFEHRPQELCVSVNGYPLAAQKVGSKLNEQTLSVNIAEKISFVEVLSEQEIRLLYLCIDEQPPDGRYQHSARVRLSDERTLEATLSFDNPWSTLQVVYHDPTLEAETATPLFETEEQATLAAKVEHERGGGAKSGLWRRLGGVVAGAWREFAGSRFWLRPGTVAAALSLALVVALLFVRTQLSVVSAAELLRRSTASEEKLAGDAKLVLRRTVKLEERRASNGDLISRRRIEILQSAAKGVRLRRIYDEGERLVAGEWVKADGTGTLYRAGVAGGEPSGPVTRDALAAGDFWRLDPSAKNFAALVENVDGVTLEDGLGTYVLNYKPAAPGDGQLLSASLRLNKTDLRATQQILFVQRGNEAREVRFIESAFERVDVDAVAPEAFEPDPLLISGAVAHVGNGSQNAKGVGGPTAPMELAPHAATAVASAELEIEVTYLLNQVKANLGEQVSLTRTTGGTLRVEALVETGGRKEEILCALAPVLNNPAVVVDVSTVDEAVRQRQAASRVNGTTEREVEVSSGATPADDDLRRHFSSRSTEAARVDDEIARFSSRVMARSRRALLHASALRGLVGRFSPDEASALAPSARAKWTAMIREHAQALQREAAMLRQDLRTVFNEPPASDASETVNQANVNQLADRLFQLSHANDEAVRASFTLSTDRRALAPVKTAQFWRSLRAAEKLASGIQNVYQK